MQDPTFCNARSLVDVGLQVQVMNLHIVVGDIHVCIVASIHTK